MVSTVNIEQIEYIGEGELCKFKDILDITSSKRVFLVTGKKSYVISGAQKYFQEIQKITDMFQFNSTFSLPVYEDVLKGVEVYKAFNPDLVVAVGGGSVMDMAKAINILACQDNIDDKYITGAEKIKYPGKKLVAIPTTSGSGSEATHFAVIYKDGVKYSLSSKLMLPAFSIVDPILSRSVPKNIATASALDAMAQAIESFWSNGSTVESRVYARESLELTLKNIIPALEKKDHSAMVSMSLAAHKAGKAINISKTTACHALSYGLTYHFKVPHGIAAAIFLPRFYLYNSKEDSAQSIFTDLNKIIGYPNSKQVANFLKNLLTRLKVTDLSVFGVKKSDVDFLANQVNIERLDNNPKTVLKSDIVQFYKELL